MIGDIRGAIIMAPMMVGALFDNRPSVAIAVAKRQHQIVSKDRKRGLMHNRDVAKSKVLRRSW